MTDIDTAVSQLFADEELEHRIKEAIDPPAVWIFG